MIRTIEELYFVPNNTDTSESPVYMHKSNKLSARKMGDELVIFSNIENQFLFIRDHSEKLNELGKLIDPDRTLSENLTIAIREGIVARDARFGLLALGLLDRGNHSEIYGLSEVF